MRIGSPVPALMLIILIGLCAPQTLDAANWYVSGATGKNSNPGTRDLPLKNIDRAIKKAAAGDTVCIAGGTYSGTFDIGFLVCDKPLKLLGSYSPDFSRRSIVKHPTLFRPSNKSAAQARKPLLTLTRNVDGTVVDGIVFDMGLRNAYHSHEGKPSGLETGMLLLPPKKTGGQNATVTEACLSIPSSSPGGAVVVQNNLFLNGAKFGIQAGMRNGILKILNNVFVANRMAAIEVYGTCPNRGGPGGKTRCAEVEIAHNTILFSWSRTKDMKDMGYGIRIMTKLEYDIHHNLIGGNVLAGVDHTRFNPDEWIRLDHNIFFANKQADLLFSPQSNTRLMLSTDQFADLELASCSDNRQRIPGELKIDPAYLEGYLNARYSEKTDFNPDSPANVWRELMGLNKQGKMTSSVSMFANRYPLNQALILFGAIKDHGAQAWD